MNQCGVQIICSFIQMAAPVFCPLHILYFQNYHIPCFVSVLSLPGLAWIINWSLEWDIFPCWHSLENNFFGQYLKWKREGYNPYLIFTRELRKQNYLVTVLPEKPVLSLPPFPFLNLFPSTSTVSASLPDSYSSRSDLIQSCAFVRKIIRIILLWNPCSQCIQLSTVV